MHIADVDKGMLGANGIVGAGIPLATGAALTAQAEAARAASRSPSSATAPPTRAPFHEALNLAAIWKLPAVFVVENNG